MSWPDDLVGKADQALIAAKKDGRDRVASARGDKPGKPRP
jgi:PleD family two-component response regulator